VLKSRERLASLLARHPTDRHRVVVVGSSAAASEVVYCLERGQAGTVVVVSPSGRLADGLASGIIAPFQCRHLTALTAAPESTSASMVAAVRKDITAGRRDGYTIVDMLPALRPAFSAAHAQLPPEEIRRFVEHDYVEYRELVRHAAPEYASAADRMTRRGTLTLIRGRVTAIRRTRAPELSVHVEEGGQRITIGATAVFDCRGFTGVRGTANPVIRDLLDTGSAAANACGRGLRVNECFEAAAGLLVLGPALAGTSHGVDHIWSLENIPRINALADRVATQLWNRLTAGLPTPVQKGNEPWRR
jgi:uncharacterized NAD(P)/FAD-binding protein YdhS